MTLEVEFLLGTDGAKSAAVNNHTVVMIDALRASTTIVTLVMKGIKLQPVPSIEEWKGIIIGEENGSRIRGCLLNNSPTEVNEASIPLNEIIGIKTTNGTNCIINAKSERNDVLIGSALNARSTAVLAQHIALKKNTPISFVLAGRKGDMAPDDLYVASLIYGYLTIPATIRGEIQPHVVDDLYSALLGTESGQGLIGLGYEKDIMASSQINISEVVPVYDGTLISAY